MTSVDVPALIEENVRLRNKLLEIAKQCVPCDGTGLVAMDFDIVAPCEVCADIRSVLE